jgi:hypothetical protein
MLAKIIGFKKRDNETMEEFMLRRGTVIKAARERYEVEGWDAHYHRLVFLWGGHVARMGQYEPGRITFQTLIYKDWNWIKRLAARKMGRQCHGRYLRTWRWEKPLYKYDLASDWQIRALNRRDWNSQLDDMVTWRLSTR